MFRTIFRSRFLFPAAGSHIRDQTSHHSSLPIKTVKHAAEQVNYIRSVTVNKVEDWSVVKNNLMNIEGSLNQKNVDGVLLRILVNDRHFDAAISFADHLKSVGDMNIGATNSLLSLYYELGLENKLTDKEKTFILNIYSDLYEKYKVLDSTTCERLLHALCVIQEWKKALKVMEDIHFTNKPTHSAYSTIVATFFKLNKKAEAMKFIQESLNNHRPLLHVAYKEWIDYILRKYKVQKTIVRHLEELCEHISRNCVVVSTATAEKIKDTYASLGWNAQFTKIRKPSGQCQSCKESLDCLKLNDDEFQSLQQNVKEKIIVGSDLFLKTSPEELKRFLAFVEETAPYDIVLDALNIGYATGKVHNSEKVKLLMTVVDHFSKENKRILLIGRKHMLYWPKIKFLMNKTSNFVTNDLSQDDPFFITAAILSGARTDIVSKDLLRGHRFSLHDDRLRTLFQRWQWQHQWMVFVDRRGEAVIQTPLPVTPCAQRKNSGWHLPYEREDVSTAGQVRDGTPDWNSWLCLAAPATAR